MVSIRPQGNRVVVQPKKASTSKGGILLPESAQQKPKEGTVVAVGPGQLLDNGQRQAMGVKVGDEVLFSAYSGHEIKQGDVEYLILAESDVLGILQA